MLNIDEHLLAEWSDSKLAVGQHLAFYAAEQYHRKFGEWPGDHCLPDTDKEQSNLRDVLANVLGAVAESLPEEVVNSIAEV